MIEFYGELSDNCKLARAKKISKNNGILFLIVTITICIPILIFGKINGVWYYALTLIAFFVIITIYAFIIPKNTVLSFKMPTKLVIEKDTISITAIGSKSPTKTKPLSKIKKVVDCGEWYNIVFKFGDITNSWVCQKNLISVGTIEEFEKLFEGKIKREVK